jgi:predicted secreted hydrolase
MQWCFTLQHNVFKAFSLPQGNAVCRFVTCCMLMWYTLIMIGIMGVLIPTEGETSTKATHHHKRYSHQGNVGPGYSWHFPKDHGLHAQYATEWWYTTGHLWTHHPKTTQKHPQPTPSPQERFGYELTFFKATPSFPQKQNGFSDFLQSPWGFAPTYTAHFALTQPAHSSPSKRFVVFEQVARSGTQEAGASPTGLKLWHRQWTLQAKAPHIWHLRTGDPQTGIPPVLNLTLTLQQPPTLQGDATGYSQKTSCTGCGSLYYSVAHIHTQGTITTLEKGRRITREVTGVSWFDHEIMQTYQYPQLIGWDWFAIQIPATRTTPRRALMLYQLRRQADKTHPYTIEPYSYAALILENGQKITAKLGKQVFLKPLRYWQSPATKGRYPVSWDITWPAQKLKLQVNTRLDNQEIITHLLKTPTYWEGTCEVKGVINQAVVSGDAYLEMTGYAPPNR